MQVELAFTSGDDEKYFAFFIPFSEIAVCPPVVYNSIISAKRAVLHFDSKTYTEESVGNILRVPLKEE